MHPMSPTHLSPQLSVHALCSIAHNVLEHGHDLRVILFEHLASTLGHSRKTRDRLLYKVGVGVGVAVGVGVGYGEDCGQRRPF
jgi:hypothetical protein